MAKNTGTLSSASMIDLKAELFRKQEEYKKKKAEILSTSEGYIKGKVEDSGSKKKTNIWSKKNKGVLERAQRDFEIKAEEEDVNEKSRKALEAKARLYDKITNSSEIPEEDGSGTYLVDFQRKVIDSIDEKIEKNREKERSPLDDDVPSPSTPDEEWVDYIDTLGRSRRCLRKDLPVLIEQDKKFSKQPGAQNEKIKSSSENLPTLLSNDMRREIERQKWEKEELEKINEGPIHYANVQHNEIRTHGVGFYQFSKNDKERKEQMETLTKIRDETVSSRSKIEKLKEKRKAQLEARLQKVKQRRKMKEGYVENEVEIKDIFYFTVESKDVFYFIVESKDVFYFIVESKDVFYFTVESKDVFYFTVEMENKESEVKKEDEIGPKIDEMLTQQRSIVDNETKKDKPLREWDKGKERLFAWSEEKYFEDRREERDPEFAPPSIYKDAPKQMGKKSKIKKNQRNSAEKLVEVQTPIETVGEKTTAHQSIDNMLSEQRSLASQPPQNTEGNLNITNLIYHPNCVPYSGDESSNYQQQWGTDPAGLGQSDLTPHIPNFSVPPPGYNPNIFLPGQNPSNHQPPIYPPPSYYPQNYAPQPNQNYVPQYSQNYMPQPNQNYMPQPNQNYELQPPRTNTNYSQYFSHQGQGLSGLNFGLKKDTVGSTVSKLDIVDTRLVKKDDGLDDLEESSNVEAISSKAVPYKPGTFYLASLKKEQEADSLDHLVSEAPLVSKPHTMDSGSQSFSSDGVIYKS
ncbi:hypothetical protein LOTGIDRAFT_236038 [Lottia gigantea]|uniref:CCDC174 alpha/beta GRSR domain-containing protein n=1 Tax=Lottia gigantea TaxID=225164 RepID=V4B8G5_LOTGI|nr:hypothetical protein LOTGIDRAFT_236038 [Lottia gigantea]ESO85019.1 hypothetical protein LOTGIDRAFT_236038 [Lottia gigantea]